MAAVCRRAAAAAAEAGKEAAHSLIICPHTAVICACSGFPVLAGYLASGPRHNLVQVSRTFTTGPAAPAGLLLQQQSRWNRNESGEPKRPAPGFLLFQAAVLLLVHTEIILMWGYACGLSGQIQSQRAR